MGINIDDLTPEQYALLQALEPADFIGGWNNNGEWDAGFIDFGRLPGEGIGLYIGKTPILEWLKQYSNICQVRRWVPDGNGDLVRTTVWANGRPAGKWTHQAQGGWVEVPRPAGWVKTIIGAFLNEVGLFLDIVDNISEETASGGPGTMYFRFTYIDAANGTRYIREIVVNPASAGKSMMVDQSWIPILYDKHATSPLYINDLSWLNTWTNRYYEK